MDPPVEFLGDNTGGFSPKHQKMKMRGNRGGIRSQPPQQTEPYGATQLFEDTSAYHEPMMFQQQDLSMPTPTFPGQQYLNDPMANMAVQYGQQFVPAAGEYVEKKIESFLSVSKLKYYFAVDTTYVLRKLGLLIFPFAQEDWSLHYDKSEPVAPRYEINSPDLYIPSMAFVTYILTCGLIFGLQNRFTPEQLGMTASSVLVWLVIELCIIITTLYVTGISADVKYLDLLALCGYKYVGMIFASLGGLLFKSTGYYVVLGWMSLSIAFFMVRTLRLYINPSIQADGVARATGNTRRLYMLLYVSLTQPLIMYFLTRHLNITAKS